MYRLQGTEVRRSASHYRGHFLLPRDIICLVLLSSSRAKCDRQVPCTQCAKRGDEAACAYPSANRSESVSDDGSARSSDATARLRKLEEMVNSLVKSNSASSQKCDGEDDDDDSELRHGVGKPHLEIIPGDPMASECNYLGQTHWRAILQNVSVEEMEVWWAVRKSTEIDLVARSEIFKARCSTSQKKKKRHHLRLI